VRVAIQVGGVYLVQDSVLTLPPESSREVHTTRRPFVVLSGDRTNQDPAWPVVLGCPLSSSTTWKTEFCIQLSAAEAGKKTWVRVPAIQPLLKDHLEDLTFTLDSGRVEEVRASLLDYVGALSP